MIATGYCRRALLLQRNMLRLIQTNVHYRGIATKLICGVLPRIARGCRSTDVFPSSSAKKKKVDDDHDQLKTLTGCIGVHAQLVPAQPPSLIHVIYRKFNPVFNRVVTAAFSDPERHRTAWSSHFSRRLRRRSHHLQGTHILGSQVSLNHDSQGLDMDVMHRRQKKRFILDLSFVSSNRDH
jgi:hypothetical protein